MFFEPLLSHARHALTYTSVLSFSTVFCYDILPFIQFQYSLVTQAFSKMSHTYSTPSIHLLMILCSMS